MGNRIGILDWLIKADTKDFDKNIKSTEKSTKKFGASLTKLGKLAASAGVIGAVVAVGKAAFNVGKDLIAAASDAEETGNKFNVVFQDVADEAEAAGQRIQDEFKLSDRDTEAFLSQVGDITSGLGATADEALLAAETITSLGLDIDSFANLAGGAEQAVSALTSLFTGEREAAKALGIVINETNLKQYAEDTGLVYKEMTQLEKGFLSLELAEKQSQLAIGDFARSIDSYANQTRIAEAATEDLKVALGESLLDAATGTQTALAGVTRALADWVTIANTARDVRKDLLDGTLEEERSLEELQQAYALLSTKIALANGQTTKAQESEKIALEALIASYGIKETFLLKEAGTREALLRQEEDLVAAEQDRVDLATKAAERLAELEESRITDKEKAIIALQKEIDYWSEYRDIAGAQAIINDRIAERNALQEESIIAIDETTQKTIALGSSSSHYYQTAISASAELAEVQAAEQTRVDELENKYREFATLGLGAVTDSISAMAEALVSGEDGWGAFAKAGLLAVASILDALAAQLVAQAASIAASFFLGNISAPAGVGAALTGAAGAALAAGTVRGIAGSFEQGGIVPEIPGVPATGDNMLARVNPGERIVPADEGGQTMSFVFQFSDDVFAKAVVDNVNSGQNLIDLSRGAYNG